MTEEKARQYIADVLRAVAYEIEEDNTVATSYNESRDVEMNSGGVAINSKTFEYQIALEDRSRIDLEVETPSSTPDWMPNLRDY